MKTYLFSSLIVILVVLFYRFLLKRFIYITSDTDESFDLYEIDLSDEDAAAE